MAKPFIKLDYDWREDPKVLLFEKRYRKAALVDMLTMFIVITDCGGSMSANDEGHMLKAQKALGATEAGVEKLLGRMAECGLIEPGAWEGLRVATSRRIREGYTESRARKERALSASKAAAEKRRREGADAGREDRGENCA